MKGSQKLWWGVLTLLTLFITAYLGSMESVRTYISTYPVQVISIFLICTSLIDLIFALTTDDKCIDLFFWNNSLNEYNLPTQITMIIAALLSPIRHVLFLILVIILGIYNIVKIINTWADKNL